MTDAEKAFEDKKLRIEEKALETEREKKEEAAAKPAPALAAKPALAPSKPTSAASKPTAPGKPGEKAEAKPAIVLERLYVVPFYRAYAKPFTVRARIAVRMVREFAARHMKADPALVRVDNALNGAINAYGVKRPPKKLKIKFTKDKDGVVWCTLAERAAQLPLPKRRGHAKQKSTRAPAGVTKPVVKAGAAKPGENPKAKAQPGAPKPASKPVAKKA